MRRMKLYPVEIAALVLLLVLLVTGTRAIRIQEGVEAGVVRFHVLANSNSPADQALKLKVRDVVLERATELLEGVEERSVAEAKLRGSLLELEEIAQAEIQRQGYQYTVTTELKSTAFPTRQYDGFSLPAGEYLALRVLIGDAEGENWWCVVFPPLCMAASTEIIETAGKSGLNPEEIALITEEGPGYSLRFKVVEIWHDLQQYLP